MVEITKEESIFLYKMLLDYQRVNQITNNPHYGIFKGDLINLQNKLFNGGLKNAN
jgi:hypothetical protein